MAYHEDFEYNNIQDIARRQIYYIYTQERSLFESQPLKKTSGHGFESELMSLCPHALHIKNYCTQQFHHSSTHEDKK